MERDSNISDSQVASPMMTIRDFLYPVEDIRHYGVKLNELLELLTDNESPVKFENLLEPTDSENSPFKEAPQLGKALLDIDILLIPKLKLFLEKCLGTEVLDLKRAIALHGFSAPIKYEFECYEGELVYILHADTTSIEEKLLKLQSNDGLKSLINDKSFSGGFGCNDNNSSKNPKEVSNIRKDQTANQSHLVPLGDNNDKVGLYNGPTSLNPYDSTPKDGNEGVDIWVQTKLESLKDKIDVSFYPSPEILSHVLNSLLKYLVLAGSSWKLVLKINICSLHSNQECEIPTLSAVNNSISSSEVNNTALTEDGNPVVGTKDAKDAHGTKIIIAITDAGLIPKSFLDHKSGCSMQV